MRWIYYIQFFNGRYFFERYLVYKGEGEMLCRLYPTRYTWSTEAYLLTPTTQE